MVSLLTKVYKIQKRLTCEKCGEKKKSVVGFVSHMMQCSKTEAEIMQMKVACQLCGSMLLPVSMAAHMRLSHGPKRKAEDSIFEVVGGDGDYLQLNTKRKSATKYCLHFNLYLPQIYL